MNTADAALLDNAVWSALTTVHEPFADGSGLALRYRPDVSVFAAVERQTPAAFAALADLAGPGRGTVLFSAADTMLPDGWSEMGGGRGHQMVLTGELPVLAETPSIRLLTIEDVSAMMELVALAQPGPFAQRTFELGGYVGIFHDARLVAMAGQRISVPGYTEISAVCTHPDARRLGYAATVTAAVARNLLERGVTPILHVADVNVNALRVYERLGFTTRRLVNFTALRTPT